MERLSIIIKALEESLQEEIAQPMSPRDYSAFLYAIRMVQKMQEDPLDGISACRCSSLRL